jgi:23S rRNA (uracil1939-C5)-methyltransferase
VTLAVGSEIDLEIDSLAAGGDGVARSEGRVVFVARGAPGDRARVRLREVHPRWARGEIAKLLAPGLARRAAPCPYAESCGGCDWQHLDEAAQRAARVAIASDALRRIGGFEELPPVEELVSPAGFGYRSRARVAFEHGRVGFRARRSREVVDVARCAVLDAPTQAALAALRADPPRGAGELELRGFGPAIAVGGRPLVVGNRSFLQANSLLWEAWRGLVLESCGRGRTAVELYAGVGFYSAGLDERFERVVAVERGPAAADLARNARVEAVAAAAEDWAPRELARLQPELVLLNPPRAGCHRLVSDALRDAAPARIVYVSCDPATLARDLREMRHRMRVTRLVVIDALPQTHHVEVLCALEVDSARDDSIRSPTVGG